METDEDLISYRKQIGEERYKKEYYRLYMEARDSNKRYSGKEYSHTKEELISIREKYKKGITDKDIKDIITNLTL